MELQVSKLGTACGKNPYESRDLCILEQKIKKNKSFYKEEFFRLGLIKLLDTENLSKRIKTFYSNIKHDINNPEEFKTKKLDIIDKIKRETDIDDKQLKFIESSLDDNMKKDCGKNNEETVINKNKFTKGNYKMWSWQNKNKGYTLKGFHDATDGELVIEIKTRMKLSNIRKNEYDLYQLFGYLLLMNKTKGKIVQYFNKVSYNSDIETDNEYGIIDINKEPYCSKFNIFLEELDRFFDDVIEKPIHLKNIFEKESVIAYMDVDGLYCNINPKYEKIINCL